MAYRFGNGKIVRDTSLILLLDAADKNSYRGTGTSWVDLNNNGTVATLSGTPTFSEAAGGGLFLNGTNQYATIGTNSLYYFSSNNPFTLCAWVRPSSVSLSEQSILGRYNGGVLGNYILSIKNNKAVIEREVSPYSTTSTTSLLAGLTYNLCGVYNGSTQRLYINGVLDPSSTSTGAIGWDQSNVSLLVGARQQNGSPAAYFGGSIYQVSIYNRALSAAEILQNFTALRGRFGV